MKTKKTVHVLIFCALLAAAAALALRAQADPVNAGSDQSPFDLTTSTPTPSPTTTNTPEPSTTPDPQSSATPTIQPTETVTPTVTATATMVPTLAGYISYLPALADIPPPSPPGCIPLPHIPADSISTEMELTAMINNYRQANDETALNLMPHLSQAARRHAWDMAENDFVDHVGSDGSSVGVRVHEACYEWLRIGQILGNAQDAESMLDSWIATEDNRELILADEYKDFGVAYVNDPDSLYQNYWVVVFGRPVAAGQYIDQDHVP